MTDKDIFISKVESYGGLYQGENQEFNILQETLKFHQKLYEKLYPQWKLPDVFMGLINNDNFLAFSFKEQDRYFIALSTGTIRVLKNLFDYIILQDVLYKDTIPQKCKQPISFNPSFKKIIDNFYRYDLEFKLNNKKDNEKSKQLLLKSLEIIIMHEFAHIKNGHLSYNIQTDLPYLLMEEDKVTSEKQNIRKVLEYDADISSINCILRKLYFTIDNTEELISEIIDLNYSLEITFNAMGLVSSNIDIFQYTTYPEASYRILYSRAGTTFFEKTDSLLEESLQNKINTEMIKHLLKSENEISLLFQRRLIDSNIFKYASNTGIFCDYILSSTYNNIREELQKHSFVTLPPKSKVNLDKQTFDIELLNTLSTLEINDKP